MAAESLLVLMEDKRIHEVDPIDFGVLKEEGLQWFFQGENHDYVAEEFMEIHEEELHQLADAAKSVHALFIRAVKKVNTESLWSQLHIPPEAIPLLQYSIKYEMEHYLIGRFDFAGGIGDLPPKLIEFNADTCSLMPETALVQERYWEQEQDQIPGEPFNQLKESLVDRFRIILRRNPDKTPSLLITSMGHEEDWLNTDLIADAAHEAGFEDIESVVLDRIIFAPEEGIFVEMGEEDYRRYDFCFKMIPWDFILFEEPELFEILDQIVQNKLAVVLNPAFSMLMQNKGLLKVMYDLEPEAPEILRATFSQNDFPDFKFVSKPFFGRMGESISLYDGSPEAKVKTPGDYEDNPMVYQQLAPFYLDWEGCRYQPSIFWTGEASALCLRRQDNLVVDDDAEFVSHVITEDPEE